VIQHSIRAVDSAYRYGGDEFVVVLPETDIVGAFVVGEKIRAGAEDLALSLSTALGGVSDPFTSVSIGLVSHPEDGLTAEELMTAADRAMYQAKMLGKNQISGNPRARPALIARRASGADAAADATDAVDDVEIVPPARAASATTAPREDRAVAVELPPVTPEPAAPPAADVDEGDDSGSQYAEEEDQADAGEVRRQIAVASRSFDPDHQIRRAMDAFLSPVGPETERRTPDH
jgi:hypothetical protein